MLTDREIKGLKPESKQYKKYDGDGLFIIVTPAGGKHWKYRYKFDGKESVLSLGKYPKVSLYDARKLRDDCARLLDAGRDPARYKDDGAIVDDVSFEFVAREWMAKKSWSDGTRARNERIILQDLAANLSRVGFSSIRATHLRACVDKIEARGASEVATRAIGMASEIFCYGVGRGYCEFDVASPLRKSIIKKPTKNMPALTDPKDIGRLMRSIDLYNDFIIRNCLLLTAYTFMRPSECRLLKWAEINWELSRIELSAERMGKNGLPFIVPLSTQAVALLRAVQVVSGKYPYVFISKNGLPRRQLPISNASALKALRIMGFTADEMVVHGFRSMASTVLNEAVGDDSRALFNSDWIERQLAHVGGAKNSKVRATYNRAQYLVERTRMMQWYADYLDSLRGNLG